MKSTGLCLCLALFIASITSAAQPKITIEKINGFEVQFVDLGVGDSFAVAWNVPLGSMSDPKPLLGRAHLLEHVVHIGTKQFPGYHAFDELLKPAGVGTNAHTSNTNTFYFAYANQNQAELVLKVHLSMLGDLEWNETNFKKERGVVINEIVEELMKGDFRALFWMPMIHSLSPDHRWAGGLLGDSQNLPKMRVQDLKELYFNNYTPEHVRVAIIGNFTDPKFREKLETWTQKYLKSFDLAQSSNALLPKVPVLANQSVPSLFTDSEGGLVESQKQIYIHSEQLQVSSVTLEGELPADLNPVSLDLFEDYLKLDVSGTLNHRLKTELGWITDFGMRPDVFQNRVHFNFFYILTEAGMAHTQEINQMLFEALASVRDNGPAKETLELLSQTRLKTFDQSVRSIDDFLDVYEPLMQVHQTPQAQIEALAQVTPKDLSKIAGLFRPDRALYATMGPDAQGLTQDKDFARGFKFKDNRLALKAYGQAFKGSARRDYRPQLRPVELQPEARKTSANAFSQSLPRPYLHERFILDAQPGLPDTAIKMGLVLGSESPEDLVRADLLVTAFKEHYSAELEYMYLKYHLSFSIERKHNVLNLATLDEEHRATPAMVWLLKRLTEFQPSPEELIRARDHFVFDQRIEHTTAFSASVAFWDSMSVLDPLYLSYHQKAEIAAHLDLTEIYSHWQRLTSATDKNFVLVGDVNEYSLNEIRKAAHDFSPNALSDDQTHGFAHRDRFELNRNVDLRLPFPEGRSLSNFGQIRLYRGPSVLDIQRRATFLALSSLLSTKVGNYNRGDQQLGYIHQVPARDVAHEYTYMAFVGQTDSTEKAQKTINGWRHVLDQLRNGEVTDEEIQSAISDQLNLLSQKKNSASEIADSYAENLPGRFDGKASEKVIEALKVTSVQDVRDSAKQYLLDETKSYFQFTMGDCEALLN